MAIDRLKLLMDNNEETVELLDTCSLISFPNHPFHLYTGERREGLKKSIQENGVMIPIIVVPNGRDKYTIISGHNRVDVCKELGISVPAIIKNLTEEEQILWLTESNFNQRAVEDMLPSELGMSLKMRNEALKIMEKTGVRVQVEPQRISEQLGDEYKLSASNVKRYIRITNLVPELLNMLDNKEFGLTVGVNLSYLPNNVQNILAEQVIANSYRISLRASEKLRELSGEITEEQIREILAPTANQEKGIKFTRKKLLKYIPESDINKAEEIIIEALQKYYAQKNGYTN